MGRRRGAVLGGLLLLQAALALPAVADDLDLAIGRLNYAGFDDKQHCTATLVAPRTALTARHCLVDGEIPEMHVLLGYDRGEWAEHLRPVTAVSAASQVDIALLCLDERSAAASIAIAERPAVPGETLLVIGYGRPNVHVANRTACRVLYIASEGAMQLDCALTPGASGAPVLRQTDESYEVVGVVSATNDAGSVAYPWGDAQGACSK